MAGAALVVPAAARGPSDEAVAELAAGPDLEDHPQVEEDEGDERDGTRGCHLVPVRAELDVDGVVHELGSPVVGVVVHVDQLELEEPRGLQTDGNENDQKYELERGLAMARK